MTNAVPLIALLMFAALVAIVLFSVVARFVRVPYPVIFVIAGAVLAFVPHVPTLRLRPEWIFLIVLPPLLFSGGWATDLASFRRNLRPITSLALGLVIVTTFAVGAVARVLLPGIPWAAAITLGAVVAPPDPVAAESVMEQLIVSQRIATIISSEGLINDSVSLVLFTFATGAMVSGHFSLLLAIGSFIGVTAGGIAIGVLVALLIEGLHRWLSRIDYADSLVNSVALLVAPYASYLAADGAHVSGVLAAVAAGMTLGYRSAYVYDAETRVMSRHFWDVLTLLINGAVFLLIGFELRGILAGIHSSPWEMVEAGAAILVVITAVRFAWVYVAAYISPLIAGGLRDRDALPSWKSLTLVAWAGMRGIVSLAAALSIPFRMGNGQNFPFRETIIALTFCVLFFTLVVQGFTLRPLVHRLGLAEGGTGEQLSASIRIRALRRALTRLRSILADGNAEPPARDYAERLRRQYERRIRFLQGHVDQSEEEAQERGKIERGVERAALQAELDEIIRLRADGDIPDRVFREIQYDLDLAFVRLGGD